jgi:hypothetical protein
MLKKLMSGFTPLEATSEMPGYGKRPRNSVFIYISLYQLHTANRGR